MMALIEWLLNNIFVVFILAAFVSWVGKRMKAGEETIERKQQQEKQQEQEQKSPVMMAEVEPRTRRSMKKEQEQMIAPQRAEEQRVERRKLPKHPLVQGVIFSEVLGPPRAKRPFGRK
ncbi:hypothetical protein NP92_09710 [Anoxybacillus gonensis]|nr:hypothetical protein [Anoxybacillus gonensis]AKS38959.1 hypothetical protein AFK25_10335 [Anoxybacillus gonensis]KGP59937.1 hypothetical protein NP92_09710 [Anoxybacillus gonensis]